MMVRSYSASSEVIFRRCVVLFVILSSVVLADPSLDDVPVPRATPVDQLGPNFSGEAAVKSRSRQFTIRGADASTRGLAANLAEEVKDEFLKLTEEKDEWTVPITIQLKGAPGDKIPLRTTALKIAFGESGYRIEIFVNLSRGLQKSIFRRAVYVGLIYGQGLEGRGAEEVETAFQVPPWLVEGLMEATAWRLKRTDRRLYDALFQHGGLFNLADLFALSEGDFLRTDSASKAAFRVSSGALVMALLEQPEGQAGLSGLLNEVASFQGEMPALLRKYFSELNFSTTSLEKLWQLQLANKGTAPLTEAYSVARTERLLREALRLRYQDDEGVLREIDLGSWAQIIELAENERNQAVRQAQDDLVRLSYRCFPSYRLLLLEYQALLTNIVRGNTQDLDLSLQTLEETRQGMVAKSEMARDFLDWFEITRARETSGAFDDYLNLKARLKDRPGKRKDDISLYLDRLEPLFYVPDGDKRGEKFDDFPSY